MNTVSPIRCKVYGRFYFCKALVYMVLCCSRKNTLKKVVKKLQNSKKCLYL